MAAECKCDETESTDGGLRVRVLVTGGSGHLGRVVTDLLGRDGHRVRVLSRRPNDDATVEWAVGDLASGEGVDAAVAGVDAVVHAATHSPAAQRGGFRVVDFVRSPTDVDIQGTSRLLNAAAQVGISHFVHASIVGLQHMAEINPYARAKLAAEQLVKEASVPWSILRATGFYWLLARMLERMAKKPVIFLPRDVHVQPVDSDEFAAIVAARVGDAERGVRRDFAGPEVLSLRELAEQYLDALGLRRPIVTAPLPRRIKHALEEGNTSAGAEQGRLAWSAWLRRSVELHQRPHDSDVQS